LIDVFTLTFARGASELAVWRLEDVLPVSNLDLAIFEGFMDSFRQAKCLT